MNVARFNKELSTIIAKAKSFEKYENFESAIKLWIEVSEMTLNASKNPSLDASFRRMLITRTEQIIEHIRDLKSPKKVPIVEQAIEPLEKSTETNTDPVKSEDSTINELGITESSGVKDDNWFNKVETAKSPEEFEEITPSSDFKILTPHDPNHVEKMKKLSEEMDMSVLKKQDNKQTDHNVGDKIVCFACGALLPAKTSVCNECGTKLN